MTPKQVVALTFLGCAYELVSAFDAQMRSKHSSRGNADKHGAHATATMEVDQFGAAKKLHRYKKHHHATNNVAGRAPVAKLEAKPKKKAKQDATVEAKEVLEEAAVQAEQILAGGDTTAHRVKQWTRLHQDKCGQVLTAIGTQVVDGVHVDGVGAHVHQLNDLTGYLKYATKQERNECKQKCLDYTDESGSTVEVEGSLNQLPTKRCESIAYIDSTGVKGVEGYCVLFSTRDWVENLDERLNLNYFKVKEIQPLEAVTPVEPVEGAVETSASGEADPDVVTTNEEVIEGPGTNLPETDPPTTAPAEEVASALQGDDDIVNPPITPIVHEETFTHIDEQDAGGDGDAHDCLANEWCCLERTDALHQITDEGVSTDVDAIEKAIEPVTKEVAVTQAANAKEDGAIQGLKNEVKELQDTVAALQPKTL